MKLVVGLGNPGKEYEETRHNAGFRLLDSIAKDQKIKFENNKKFLALICEWSYKNEKVILLKPQTFMNLSGKSILSVMQFYKLSPVDILILHDDLDIEKGKVKFREKGSSGGHNGLNSIIETLGTTDFARIKIGIGRPTEKYDVTNYVLEKLGLKGKFEMDLSFPVAKDLLIKWLEK